MLKKRVIISLTFLDGILFRTKKFVPDYRYTKNFIDLWNADEIILIDVSSKEKKLNEEFINVIKFFIKNCHLPITVGGGIDSEHKAKKIFELGVERIILNGLSYANPDLTNNICEIYGSSSIIHSFDCKKINNKYSAFIENGNKEINENFLEYFKRINTYKIGEILINNINNDGGLMGYDIDLIKLLSKYAKTPVIVQGGAGSWKHFYDVLSLNNVYGACTQNIYHFTESSMLALKKYLLNKEINVRYDH